MQMIYVLNTDFLLLNRVWDHHPLFSATHCSVGFFCIVINIAGKRLSCHRSKSALGPWRLKVCIVYPHIGPDVLWAITVDMAVVQQMLTIRSYDTKMVGSSQVAIEFFMDEFKAGREGF